MSLIIRVSHVNFEIKRVFRYFGEAVCATRALLDRFWLTMVLKRAGIIYSVAITFDPATMALICQLEGSEDTLEVPIQGITKAELMGELGLLQALPMYQLALPFSLAAWRQLEYAHHLAGTT